MLHELFLWQDYSHNDAILSYCDRFLSFVIIFLILFVS